MNKILVVITAFSLGYVLNDLTEGNVQLIPEAQAEMSRYDIELAVQSAMPDIESEVKSAINGCLIQRDPDADGASYIYCY
jgi:hypothetical protein